MDFEKYHVCDNNQSVLGIQVHTEIYAAIKKIRPQFGKTKNEKLL